MIPTSKCLDIIVLYNKTYSFCKMLTKPDMIFASDNFFLLLTQKKNQHDRFSNECIFLKKNYIL